MATLGADLAEKRNQEETVDAPMQIPSAGNNQFSWIGEVTNVSKWFNLKRKPI
jgi:hypothetical protein